MKALRVIFTILFIIPLIGLSIVWQVVLPVKVVVENESFFKEVVPAMAETSFAIFLDEYEDYLEIDDYTQYEREEIIRTVEAIKVIVSPDDIQEITSDFMYDYYDYVRYGGKPPIIELTPYLDEIAAELSLTTEEVKAYIEYDEMIYTEDWYATNQYTQDDFLRNAGRYVSFVDYAFWAITVAIVVLATIILLIWMRNIRVAFVIHGTLLILFGIGCFIGYIVCISYGFATGFIMDIVIYQGVDIPHSMVGPLFASISYLIEDVGTSYLFPAVGGLFTGIALCIAAAFMRSKSEITVTE